MLNKIYLIALGIFILIMFFLSYFAFSWLGSITAPEDVKRNFESWFAVGRIFLLISSLILLVFSNLILWKTRQTWTFWATLAYFIIFILLQTFWLDRAFREYQIIKRLIEDDVSLTPVISVFLLIAAAGFIFFNQFLALRMHDRMFAKGSEIKELSEEDTVESDEKLSE